MKEGWDKSAAQAILVCSEHKSLAWPTSGGRAWAGGENGIALEQIWRSSVLGSKASMKLPSPRTPKLRNDFLSLFLTRALQGHEVG